MIARAALLRDSVVSRSITLLYKGSQPAPEDSRLGALLMPGATSQRIDRALLIGIDSYESIGPNLSGCVGDVEAVARFLTERLSTPAGQIIKLTSSLEGTEEAASLATRDNIIAAFKHFAQLSLKDDQIYIQYSGHGMRNDCTILPGIEPDGRDEAIAPLDSGYEDPAAFYILDKELGWLIKQITDTGAFVTFVSDCCHSASMTRAATGVKIRKGQRKAAGTAGGRGWEGGDPRPRPDSTLVAPRSELKALFTSTAGGTGSLLPAPRNYILMTGCRERETAKEFQGNGAFTIFMLEHLKRDFTGLSYRSLVDRIGSSMIQLASTNADYRDQTPQLEGNPELLVLGGGAELEPVVMTATPLADGTVHVAGGAAIGLSVGTVLALYPPGASDVNDAAQQVGIITLISVAPDVSIGAPAEGEAIVGLVVGMRAVVVRPNLVRVKRRVAIGDGADLARLKTAVAQRGRDQKGSPYLEVVAPGNEEEFSVVVQGEEFVILDNRDQPVPRLSPPIAVSEPGAPQTMLQRLEHLVQYRNAWDLHNDVDSSNLKDTLSISVVRRNTRSAGRVELRLGENVRIQIHNRSNRPLSAALLYFGADWSIKRIWPDGATAYEELAATGDDGLEVYEAVASLPAGESSSHERLKLFATDKPTSFDALSLNSLDVARTENRTTRSMSANPLENLLADMGEGRATRELLARRSGTGDWSTAELELELELEAGTAPGWRDAVNQ
jgi:hypothetical protein